MLPRTFLQEEKPIKVIIIVHDGEKLVIRMMATMWREDEREKKEARRYYTEWNGK